jgi:lactate dehydrogenase-like 2-hydroxyacid dehydrogenase
VIPRIFVVQPIPEAALDIMRAVAEVELYPYTDRQITVGELAEAAMRSDYLYTMHETIITREVLQANPKLKGIGLGGSEYREMIDVAACEQAGIPLIFHSGEGHDIARASNAKATADLTVAMVLNLAYRVVEADSYTRAGGFRQEMTMDLMGVGCPGRTTGIIGMGRVAKEMVPRLKAFEMEILYTKRSRLSADEEVDLGVRWVDSLHQLLPQCDYVCMMANYSPSAHMLMGQAEFELMKPTAYFVNTARGRLVDEPAMIRALQDGTIAGAGLDVYWNEPPVVHDPFVPEELRKLDNVVLAPHNGGATWESRGAQTSGLANAIAAAIETAAVAPDALEQAALSGPR